MDNRFDVIVIGGGHAGTEAALAAARSGVQTLLLTQNKNTLGQMSCNPAIGGVGKGHLVKEIDALGGMMALAADDAGIQFRRLNSSRGAAVRATRAQSDRELYKATVQLRLEIAPNLCVLQCTVDDIIVQNGHATGVLTNTTDNGNKFFAPAIVLTAGTFLAGIIHIGKQQIAGGRAGCKPATTLAARLRELNLPVGRLKTGTPPRLDGRSIDFSQLTEQPGDTPRPVFSFIGAAHRHPPQRVCHITNTTPSTHDIIRAALSDSPLFSGAIEGAGPRYCPSIEDKVTRFAERESHRIFLEPESLREDCEYYPNGISTSLPKEAQANFVRTIPGLAHARITRLGYAIEYDFFDPRALLPSLQTRTLPGLFFAGQINGTTGYEEAAAQGLIAGLNAARLATDKPPWTPTREESYIGVMIDDLTARGVIEPYRMFTSRAECRLSLREDNADLRLTETGRRLNLVDDERWRLFCARRERLEKEELRLNTLKMRDTSVTAAPAQSVARWLRGPEAHYVDLCLPDALSDTADIAEMEARCKYAGYIQHQQAQLARAGEEDAMRIPNNFDISAIAGLSHEVQELFHRHHPVSIRQARRISGITPAALAIVAAHLKTREITDKMRSV